MINQKNIFFNLILLIILSVLILSCAMTVSNSDKTNAYNDIKDLYKTVRSSKYQVNSWWTFDSSLKDCINNQNGKGFSVQLHTPGTEGKLERCYNFSDKFYIKVADDGNKLDFGVSDFSISCWIKTSSTKSILTLLDKREKKQEKVYQVKGYHLVLYNGKLLLQLADENGHKNFWGGKNDPHKLNDGKWHFITVTVDRDNSNGLKFYIDGKLTNTLNPTSKQGDISNDAPLLIGKHLYRDKYRFNGEIDELRMISKVLTYAEMRKYYVMRYIKVENKDDLKQIVNVYVKSSEIAKGFFWEDFLNVGYTKEYDNGKINSEISRSYLKINLNNIPENAVVYKSSLRLQLVNHSITNKAPNPLMLHKVTSDWKHYIINWKNQPSYKLTPEQITDFQYQEPLKNGRHDLGIKETVQNWINYPENNLGFVLKTKYESGEYYSKMTFHSLLKSSPPVLNVWYFLPEEL